MGSAGCQPAASGILPDALDGAVHRNRVRFACDPHTGRRQDAVACGLEARAPLFFLRSVLEPRREHRGLDFVETLHGEIGGGEFAGGVGGGHADHAHAAGASGGDADVGVLEDD